MFSAITLLTVGLPGFDAVLHDVKFFTIVFMNACMQPNIVLGILCLSLSISLSVLHQFDAVRLGLFVCVVLPSLLKIFIRQIESR